MWTREPLQGLHPEVSDHNLHVRASPRQIQASAPSPRGTCHPANSLEGSDGCLVYSDSSERQRGDAAEPRDAPPRFDEHSAADAKLIGALAEYLGSTRDKDHVRRAIKAWGHDIVRLGMRPERVLIQFKDILSNLTLAQQATDDDVRLADRREIILMCIEEYFSEAASGSKPPEPD